MEKSEIGLIGLAVMGQNLALNMAGRGIGVAVHNRTVEKAERFMSERAGGLPIRHGRSLEELAGLLERPRRIMIMVKAGEAVDRTLSALVPLLDPGDLIMDCGNSHFQDTERRARMLSDRGIEFMGVGVSGGEEGALKGPSIMPGGKRECYDLVAPVLEKISARTEAGPCVTCVGPGGAGHYVKMVHNGLEYGDMQLIAEVYDVLGRGAGMSSEELASAFEEHNRGALASYLMEITVDILREIDPDTGLPLVEVILDRAGQKGTGRWTSANALELGEPTPTITAAVEARGLSAKKDQRMEAEKALAGPGGPALDGPGLVSPVFDALLGSRLSLYAQGMALLSRASEAYDYGLSLPELARIWKGGCIIRSGLLDYLRRGFSQSPPPANMLIYKEVVEMLAKCEPGWRHTVQACAGSGIPCPALGASLSYFDGYRTGRLPAGLIQAQRDLFGAHTFERVDREGVFHHAWPAKKGVTGPE